MNDKNDNISFTHNSSLHTPKHFDQTIKESRMAKSFRSLFTNHFLQKSYKKSSHFPSNKTTLQSTCHKSVENKPISLSFLKNQQLSSSRMDSFSNQYKKLLFGKLTDENFDGFNKKVLKEFRIFKDFTKTFLISQTLFGENTVQTQPIGNDIYYFLYKLDEFFQEKCLEVIGLQNLTEKFIKETFLFIFDQMQFVNYCSAFVS